MKTIQCRLVAPEYTRRVFWELMADINTPKISHAFEKLPHQPDFEVWRSRGSIPEKAISKSIKTLDTGTVHSIPIPVWEERSAVSLVKQTIKASFQTQKKLQRRIQGKERWLSLLASDPELEVRSGLSISQLRSLASSLLQELGEYSPNRKPSQALRQKLFERYDSEDREQHKAAVAYLLKTNCSIHKTAEDPEQYAKRRFKSEFGLQRARKQLAARMPSGRDLYGDRWQEFLKEAREIVPAGNDELKNWQSVLLSRIDSLPYPLSIQSNSFLHWSKNDRGRLQLRLQKLLDYPLSIYCDRRHLHWFQRFYEDHKTLKDSKGKKSEGLLTLRSVKLHWQLGEGQGEPWNIHHLKLSCTVDPNLWTQEGTQQVSLKKIESCRQKVAALDDKDELSTTQQSFRRRLQSSVERLQHGYPRPSKKPYRGNPHIAVGVSLGLKVPVTIAVVDVVQQQAIAYRSTRELLGSHYPQLCRYRQLQVQNSWKRRKRQKQGQYAEVRESNIGKHLDRLLAKAIVRVAVEYKAASIVLPELKGMRTKLVNEMQYLAQLKHPSSIWLQKRYSKQQLSSIHRWSYGRLLTFVQNAAGQARVEIVQIKVPFHPKQKAAARAAVYSAWDIHQFDSLDNPEKNELTIH